MLMYQSSIKLTFIYLMMRNELGRRLPVMIFVKFPCVRQSISTKVNVIENCKYRRFSPKTILNCNAFHSHVSSNNNKIMVESRQRQIPT